MRQAALIVATVLKEIAQIVQPGMTTGDLDAYAEKSIREMSATPSFKGYHGFPGRMSAANGAKRNVDPKAGFPEILHLTHSTP